MTQEKRVSAELLNAHLAAGGEIQLTTYGSSMLFKKRNAGCFYQATNGETWYGKGLKPRSRWVVATPEGKPYASLRFYSPA